MALESSAFKIIEAFKARLISTPLIRNHIIAPANVEVDTSFRLPDRGDYSDNSTYKRANFQVHLLDELYTLLAEEPVIEEGETTYSGRKTYEVDATLHITYYHADDSTPTGNDQAQQNAYRNSDIVIDHINAFEETLRSLTLAGEGYVESLTFQRRTVLDKKYGLSANQIPMRHVFAIKYFTGSRLAYNAP